MTQPYKIQQPLVDTIACHECDLLVRLKPLSSGHKSLCPRCGYLLTRYFDNASDKILAFSISALLFLFFALPFVFISFASQGKEREITFLQSIQSLNKLDFNSLAALIMTTTFLIPAVFLMGLIYVNISIKNQILYPLTKPMLKFIFILLNWNMAEIFLVGVLVSFIKIISLASIHIGISFYSYILFIVCLSSALSYLDQYQIWQWVKRNE